MTEDRTMISNLILSDAGHVTFDDNNKGKIKQQGTIMLNRKVIIDQVLLVEGLKHNLISVYLDTILEKQEKRLQCISQTSKNH